MDENLSTSRFTFSFEGTHEVSASHLAASLNALNTLVLETQETCYPDTSCNLRVTANRQGSFEIDLSVLAVTASNLFTKENIDYAVSIVKLVLQFFDIKKHIKDSPPKVTKETGKTIVENSDGVVKEYSSEAYSFFKNAKIENAIVQIVDTGATAENVTGIRMVAKDGENITIDETEFSTLKTAVVSDANVPTQTITSTDTFYVKQATLIGEAQWVFVKDRSFHAKILDTDWLAEYGKGKYPVVPGLRLRAEMITVLQIGENGLPIEGKATHEIIKVLDVIYPEEHKQTEL